MVNKYLSTLLYSVLHVVVFSLANSAAIEATTAGRRYRAADEIYYSYYCWYIEENNVRKWKWLAEFLFFYISRKKKKENHRLVGSPLHKPVSLVRLLELTVFYYSGGDFLFLFRLLLLLLLLLKPLLFSINVSVTTSSCCCTAKVHNRHYMSKKYV